MISQNETCRCSCACCEEHHKVFKLYESKLDKYRGVVVAALNWRGTYGIPNNEINEMHGHEINLGNFVPLLAWLLESPLS